MTSIYLKIKEVYTKMVKRKRKKKIIKKMKRINLIKKKKIKLHRQMQLIKWKRKN
jgi:hypothetical protein